MRRLSLALLAAGLFVVGAGRPVPPSARPVALAATLPPPALDQYSGFAGLACENQTGHFTLEKVGNRWWFCTPAGHVFTSMSVGDVEPASQGTLDCNGNSAYDLLISKYGDTTYNWAWQTLRRMTAWGFNSIGQDSVGEVWPTYTCSGCVWPGGTPPVKLPYIVENWPATYASVNLRGYASGPLKDLMTGLNGNYIAWRAMLPDVFDPKLQQWWTSDLAHDTQPAAVALRNNSPWILGVFTDDSDYFWGSGAGTDFPTWPSGHNNANIGYMVMIASPTQTYDLSTQYRGEKELYTDTEVYTKAQATNPKTPCSISNPCSLRDYLWQKYGGSISALNAAWGSDYTTFDSTGIQVSGEVVGIGDGAQTTFTHTLAHTPVSPNSVLILTGGTAEGGDCPWFDSKCGVSSNTGSIGSPAARSINPSSSRISYATGALTLTFLTPPPRGATITVNYIYGGWMAGGTGLMDESGNGSWIGTNNWCLEKGGTSYDTCVSGQNGTPNANAQVGPDLDNWVSQMSAEYFKTMRDGLARYSSLPYLGLDTIGSWSAPASKFFLQGAAPYVNGAFVTLYGDLPSAPQSLAMYSYLTQYLGDVPLIDFITLTAEPDSAESCHPERHTFMRQQARGAEYYTTVNTFLTTSSYNKDYPWVGVDWWAWQDFQNSNQGLVSIHDNAYDGQEAVIAVGKDQWGYPTGGEVANYGDCLTRIEAANALWYTLLP